MMSQTILKFDRAWMKISRFVKFLLVGCSGTALDYAVLFALKFLGTPTLLANVCSSSLGMMNNYYLNKNWTFSNFSTKSPRKQFGKYFIVSLIGLGINTMVLLSLEEPFESIFSHSAFGFMIAKVTATIVAFFWNYLANIAWTFKEPVHLEVKA